MEPTFASLKLSAPAREALALLGFTLPTPIQTAALPPALAGRDVAGHAETGSGKTVAFGLPIVERLQPALHPQALVLCPTRELADQVAASLRLLAARLPNTRILTLCGGRPLRTDRLALAQGAHVIVGTPGRVADHLRRGTLNLDKLSILVLDEADRMLDMGFVDEVAGIVEATPPTRQTLLFSATFPDGIQSLSASIQRDPVAVSVDAQVDSARLQQAVYRCEQSERRSLVARLLAAREPTSALIFCETRDDCDRMARFLTARGGLALALHGGLEQRDRDAVLQQFANGSTRLLVATNVASRGLDIPDLPLVVIAEIARDASAHLHRIGRTGRAGKSGWALSVVAGPHEENRLRAVEELLGQPLSAPEAPPEDLDLTGWEPSVQTLLILSGRKDKLRKGDLLGALVHDGGLESAAIGRIDIQDRTATVAIRRDVASKAYRFLERGRVKNRRVRVRLLD